MTNIENQSGGDLFIVDNDDAEWKVARYLQEWTEIARAFDIASAYFEIGALLSLDGHWQKLDSIRLLMGDEVSLRTKDAFERSFETIRKRLDTSIEDEKSKDDFLAGVPAIVDALQAGKIQARVYRDRKFHAKAYITHGRLAVVGSSALVGSSNFTYPGLYQNVELNIQVRSKVEELQAWFERYWEAAEDVTPDILKTVERHTFPYEPFHIYARSMAAYFRAHEMSATEWERSQSQMYPILDQYQREGYHSLMRIAARYNGALLCDGVGLGKTFIGLMVIERLLFDKKKVALFVPKAARADVWEAKLRRFLPDVRGHFSNLVIYNHTDLLRGGQYPDLIQEVADKVDAIVIDEAHHFRSVASERSRKLFELTENKQVFLLTATPVNNSLYDLMHLIEYFSRAAPGYFSEAPLGIHTLRGHFRKMEEALQDQVDAGNGSVEVDPVAAERVLANDTLFQALVVQRSRAYVRRSLEAQGGRQIAFPVRADPQVANYSLTKTYGSLLDKIEEGFSSAKPLLTLGVYYPLMYLHTNKEQVDAFEEGRQKQIVGLVRTLLLKRFESSAVAFQASCEDLLLKLLQHIEYYAPRTAQRWSDQHTHLLGRVTNHALSRRGATKEADADEDVIPEELKQDIEVLDEVIYNTGAMVLDTMLDLDVLANFLYELAEFDPATDDKLQTLIRLMQTHETLRNHKVLIFTEYRDTARYLAEQLALAGIGPVAEVDSQSSNSVSDTVHAFSPYYNEYSSADLAAAGKQEIRVLVATDILAEGLNLQDATCIINYDLHWNPVRLMQRIGRVDRRLDWQTEARLIADHPEVEPIRGHVLLWNFLPPAELNRVLSLYQRVTHKTLRISKTFGIEGKKLLTPQDDYNALRDFNQVYEGTTTSAEELFLAYQRLLASYPDLPLWAEALPLRLFSGKGDSESAPRGVFFCYRLPAKDAVTGEWDDQASFTRWYFYRMEDGHIEDDASVIYPLISCDESTPRVVRMERSDLTAIRQKLDQHVKQSYMRRVQAPAGVKATLLAWMEVG